MPKVGIIGGSGLDNPDFMKNYEEISLETEYGMPSSVIKTGTISGVDTVIVARHGKDHSITPSGVNYRANISALQQLGASHIIATTACGSLREEIGRGDLVIVDQFIDFTKNRINTFHTDFTKGVIHCAMADPFDKTLRNILFETASELGIKAHPKGTVITIEGPRFSTRAESHMFRSWGADVINMSIATETALAAEAGIPYAAIAMSTDYDCWKEDEAAVTIDDVFRVFAENVSKVKQVILQAVEKIGKL